MTVAPGERVPNFMRYRASGVPVTLYQDYCARRVVLMSPAPGTPDLAMAARLAAPDGAWQLLVLLRGSPAQIADQAARLPEGALALADDGAIIDFLAASRQQAFALVLDRNFRLLQRLDPARADLALVAQIYTQSEPAVFAPVLIVPRLLDATLCTELTDAYARESEPSGVARMENGRLVYGEDHQVKIRREHRLQPGPLWHRLEERMRRCLLPEIQWAFNYRVTRFEGVKVVAYAADAGGFFSPHRDNDGSDTAHRRFAMTVNLNPDDYAGGDLCFPEYGDAGYRPGAGSAIVFSCNLAHEARPVTQGVRMALVSFFFSDSETLEPAGFDNQVAR